MPKPRMNLPPDIDCKVKLVITKLPGVRLPTCTIPVPRRISDVTAAKYARGVIASVPQASEVQIESAPNDSASLANSAI